MADSFISILDKFDKYVLNLQSNIYAWINDNATINFGDNISVFFRMKSTQATSLVRIASKFASSGTGWLVDNPSNLRVSVRRNNTGVDLNSTGIALNDGLEHTVCFTFKADEVNGLKVYVDGVLAVQANTTSIPTSGVGSNAELQLGFLSAFGGTRYIGEMDDFLYYNAILTAEQILDAHKWRIYPQGYAVFLPMIDGSGTNISDFSGNNNDFTLTASTSVWLSGGEDQLNTAKEKIIIDNLTPIIITDVGSGFGDLTAAKNAFTVTEAPNFIVLDLMNTAPAGTLKNSATYITRSHVRLTQASSNTSGQLEYVGPLPKSFKAQFLGYRTGAADGVYFYWGASGTVVNATSVTGGGYRVAFWQFQRQVRLYWQNNLLATYDILMPTSTYYAAEIVVKDNNVKVYFNGYLVIDFTDTTRTLDGNLYGVGAWCGGQNSEHRLDDFIVNNGIHSGDGLTRKNMVSIAEGNVIAADNFDRANGDLNGQTTPVGGYTWLSAAGTFEILDNQAKPKSNSVNDMTTINVGVPNVSAKVTMAVWGGGANQSLIFRRTNNSNYWRFYYEGTAFRVQRIVSSVFSTIATSEPMARNNGDVLEVKCLGSLIECYVNGSKVISIIDTSMQTATQFGIGVIFSSSLVRYDNFEVKEIKGLDTFSLSAKSSVADNGLASDISTVSVDSSVGDNGNGNDTTNIAAEVVVSENSSATDVLNVLVALTMLDSGEGVEMLSIFAQLLLSENATGQEALSVLVQAVENEVVTANEVVSIIANVLVDDQSVHDEMIGIKNIARQIRRMLKGKPAIVHADYLLKRADKGGMIKMDDTN